MENKLQPAEAQPQETAAQPESAQFRIPVKFNKETRELSPEEAAMYAQKGMKFDQISPEFERLRALAKKRGQSVPELVEGLCRDQRKTRLSELTEQCGGNEALASHVLELEDAVAGTEDSFAELQKNFPAIRSPKDLPESVVSAAEEKGTRLLDEYLRYRFFEDRARKNAEADRENANRAAVGSQKKYAVGTDPVQMEFLRGIWGR